MEWYDKTFNQLSTNELFDITLLRANVFNGEQKCVTPDPDLMDKQAHHVFALEKGKLTAYGRYFQEDDHVTLGRVVVNPLHRGQGLGLQLVSHILDGIKQNYGGKKIVLHAQLYTKGFYEHLGFKPSGDIFFEAEREHIIMTHPAM